MPVFAHQISTLPGPHRYRQDVILERLKTWTADTKTRRLLHALYGRSGIETRHSVLPDFLQPEGGGLYQWSAESGLNLAATAARNAVFGVEATKMAVAAGRDALEKSGFEANQITHVIFVSCTGFVNPGPDYALVRELGLSPHTQRYTLGFMGCYAALPALRMATQFCTADSNAVALVVSTEICTLHLQCEGGEDALLAGSLFADGAAAVVVSSQPPAKGKPALLLDPALFQTALLPEGDTAMAWEIGDSGFQLVLSSYVPRLLEASLRSLLETMGAAVNVDFLAPRHWAVHPGGRSILDKTAAALRLPTDALDDSRAVLREFGNMSSATILFVLERLLQQPGPPGPSDITALAFGPGLTVECARLQKITAS